MQQLVDVQVPVEAFTARMNNSQIEILRDFDTRQARFFLVNWHRRARKTTLALNLLIKECLTHEKHRYCYITSTYKAAKNIVWRDPLMLKQYLPMQFVERLNESELFVEFKNGSILSIHGGDEPDALRGINAHGIVMDEAPLCKRELWDEILRPIIAQDIRRWAVFIFTPKGRNWIHELWVKAKLNPEWKQYKLDVWTSGIIDPVEIAKLQKDIPQATFNQEFECEFNDNASSVFKNINECISGTFEAPKLNVQTYVTGVDLARINDFTVLTTICRETRRVVAFERFNRVDWAFQKERIIDMCRRYNSLAVVDSTGIGDPISEDLARQGVSTLPFKISSSSKQELIKRLIVSIEQRLITFPPIDDMLDELRSFAYDVTDAGNIRYSAPDGMHDDCVISLALANYGMKNFIYGKKERAKPDIMTKRNEKEIVNAGFGY